MIGNDFTTQLLQRALAASELRQRVIAHNVANVQTPGFKRSRVDFERHLTSAMSKSQLLSVQPNVVVEKETMGRADGNNVDLEREMTMMAENQIYHAALTRQFSDHFARLRSVIHEGRR